MVQILREDWGITEGETLEGYLLNIKELRKKEYRKKKASKISAKRRRRCLSWLALAILRQRLVCVILFCV